MVNKENNNNDGLDHNMILVAEDDTSNFLLLKVYLDNLNYQILHAHDGEEAVELAKNNSSISVAIMDIKMPNKDGIQATKEIKAQNPDITIIALTAYAMPGDKDKVFNAGCDEYLTKPVLKDDLFNLLNKYISTAE